MASVSIRTRRQPSVLCGTWMGESSVVVRSVLTTLQVRKIKKNSKVRPLFFLMQQQCFMQVFWFTVLIDVLIWCVYATGLGTGAPTIESPYGDSVQPQEAPESISRAVASLPPEQMFELMKQMKVRTFASWLFYNPEKRWFFPALKMLVFTGQSLNAAGGNLSLHSYPSPSTVFWNTFICWFFSEIIYTDSEQKSYV